MMVQSEIESAIQEQLQAMRRQYQVQLSEKMHEIECIWKKLLSMGWDERVLKDLYLKLHSLEGGGGTYGFLSISSAAHELSAEVDSMLESGTLPAGQMEQFGLLFDSLRQEIQSSKSDHCSSSSPPSPRLEDDYFISPQQPSFPPDHDKWLIFLVEDEEAIARELALQIKRFGYDVRTFTQLQDFRFALHNAVPSAIIMDIIFPEGALAGLDAIAEVQKSCKYQMPTIFISVKKDFETRLSAIRVGGKAFLPKPIDVSLLVDKLDALLTHKQEESYRILIIEDDLSQGQYYASILQHAGMVTKHITDPMGALEILPEFGADLVMMDLYMPNCNGLELATIIRQDESFVSIPIVFLSVETDLTKQLTALCRGGDDFLKKPVRPEHLISSITARVERARILRTFMLRDSMTGLLNHTRIKEQMEFELLRSQRSGTPVSLAILDLDRFKSVNDTYGHQTGDKIIKSLARLLRQRLRKSDVIGRYGGEEFAVILPDTQGEDAMEVMNEIREDFAAIRHQHGHTEFNVTFSCGIATFPPHDDPIELTNAADAALYKAKHGGRNRVMSAS